MDVTIDHYNVLGLSSGEEGAKLMEKEISKAYKFKALELHPDKRPDDPNAHENFQRLKSSYEILKDEKARKLFDDLLRVRRKRQHRNSQSGTKRQRMVADLNERERASFEPDLTTKAREEEERIARKLKEEIARIRAMLANKRTSAGTVPLKKEAAGMRKENMGNGGDNLDKGKILKVSWEKGGVNYTAERLREVFTKFGAVEDVVINISKKRNSALIVMASKDAAAAATRCVCGDLSNPLLVVLLRPTIPTGFYSAQEPVEPDNVNKPVGMGFKNFEDSVLEKLEKATQKKKMT